MDEQRSRYIHHENRTAAAKRVMDIAIASFCLTALLPLFGLITAAIWLDSGRPVLYAQERTGRNGRVFRMFKFRSMVADAERSTGPVWAAPNDARATRVGAFLRRKHLDEMPQFWNVLRGEMSVVGPRPERPGIAADLTQAVPGYMERYRVPPGITGLAQVRSGYDTSVRTVRRKSRYDRHYIRKCCLLLDLKIMASTLRVVAG